MTKQWDNVWDMAKVTQCEKRFKEQNSVAFYGVQRRIRTYRQHLQDIQSSLRKPGQAHDIIEIEKRGITESGEID